MKRAFIFSGLFVIFCAGPSFGDTGADPAESAECRKSVGEYMFQDASERIKELKFNFWPVKPMKAAEPVKKEDMLFQKMANGVKGMPDNIK